MPAASRLPFDPQSQRVYRNIEALLNCRVWLETYWVTNNPLIRLIYTATFFWPHYYLKKVNYRCQMKPNWVFLKSRYERECETTLKVINTWIRAKLRQFKVSQSTLQIQALYLCIYLWSLSLARSWASENWEVQYSRMKILLLCSLYYRGVGR
jgi:hypothetical protein